MKLNTILFLISTLAAHTTFAEPPPLALENLGSPVTTIRLWNSTLVQNARGQWRWIGEFMNYENTTGRKCVRKKVEGTDRVYVAYEDTESRPDAEWVIADLAAGKTRIQELPGFHGSFGVRAENGRVFFPVDFMQMWYYDPSEDALKILGELCEWKPYTNDRDLYRLVLGRDGCLYGTTQSYSGKSALVQINPDTLKWKVFTDVGAHRPVGLTYGYYLALDLPWAYMAVGQGDWELMAVNVVTGEKRLLAERHGKNARVVVTEKGVVTAELIDASGKKDAWCLDGKLVDAVQNADGALPYTPLDKKTYTHIPWTKTKPMAAGTPPELNPAHQGEMDSTGRFALRWRSAGSTGDFQAVRFQVKDAEPQAIVSMVPLPDGSIFGGVRQYNGFFRYHPQTAKMEYFGKFGPSDPKMALVDGKVWYFGYPNVNLSVYDPDRPWTPAAKKAPGAKKNVAEDPQANPRFIGYFGSTVTEAHHSRVILPGPNGRLYLLGQRERWSTGSGLGYCEIATGRKFGLGNDMKDLNPQGMVLLPKLGRIVVSGKSMSKEKSPTAQFRVYDLDLKEVERLTLKEGLAATGLIQNIGQDHCFLGRVDGEGHDTLYLYDLAAKAIVKWVELDGQVNGWSFQRPTDGTWWIFKDATLCKLNPETLELTPVGKLPKPLNQALWIGNILYGSSGGELFRVKDGNL